MKERAALPVSQVSGVATAPRAPLWAMGLALLLGALGALAPSSGHVHQGGHEPYAHQHLFAGPHLHPETPAAPVSSEGEGSSEEAPAGRDAQVVALSLALSLEVALPALRPAAPAPRAAPSPQRPPLLRPAAAHDPASPRGPPALPC